MHRLIALVVPLLLLGACIPPEPDDDLIRNFDPEETVMGTLQERGELRIGIDEQFVPPRNNSGGVFSFAKSLAEEVGRSLGIPQDGWTISVASTSALMQGIEDDTFDVVFPFLPVTEKRIKSLRPTHSFTDPYLVAHQRLLVPHEAGEGMERVCSFADAETAADLTLVVEDAVVASGRPATCGEALAAGRVDAVTGPDIVLAGIAAALPELEVVGDQLNTEGYAAVVEAGAGAWTDYVGQVMEEAQQEGRWTDYFTAYLTPGLQEEQGPPGMSVEEAAALFPSDAAL